VFSDEINLLFTKPTSFRRIEKIDSIFAALTSTIFSSFLRKKFKKLPYIAFDCRVIPIGDKNVLKYFIWRQAEAFRNFNNAYATHVLIKKGTSAREAAKKLEGIKTKQLRELIKKHGIKLEKIPSWQENGIGVYWKYYKKVGYDPIKKKKTVVKRRKPVIDWKLPKFNSVEGKKFLKKLIE
jgi:tRNA(His) 5'-end guanylyltransferase